MPTYIDQKFDKSFEYLQMVQPCLETLLGCKMILIDKRQGELQAALDQVAGIDAIIIRDGKPLGIAFKVQWADDWETMTVRYQRSTGNDTEFQKYDLDHRSLQANWSMQLYLREGKLCVYLARTDDLMRYVHENESSVPVRTSDQEGNTFLVVQTDGKEWIRRKEIDCGQCTRRKHAN